MTHYSCAVVRTPGDSLAESSRSTAYQPMTLDDLASYLAASADERRWLLLAEFLTEFGFEDRPGRQRLLTDRPRPTGSKEWDALLGALGEHLAFHDEADIPKWVDEPDRFLEVFWFPTNTAAARADAVVHAPASFLRRGVMIERRSLERV